MKRRYNDGQQEQGGYYQERRYHQPPSFKRGRYQQERRPAPPEVDNSPESHLKSLIYVVGDEKSMLSVHVNALASIIIRDYVEHKRVILKTLEAW